MRLPRSAAPVLLAVALAGCGGMASAPPGGAGTDGRQPAAVALSTQQGGRFEVLDGPRRQHAEPFLGVSDTNVFHLHSAIDRATGEVNHQLVVADSYSGPPRDWYAARDAQGRPLRFIPIGRDEITCQPSCSYAEEFAAVIPDPQLRGATGGLTVAFAARSGAEKTIAVPGELVKAQVNALDRVRAGLATASAIQQPAPTAPPRP
jgi:hypothetical protein